MIEKHDYTIDEKFIFEQRTSRIYLKDDPDQSVELSKPAARLFGEILLLNIKKGMATRDELLTNVWEEYGLVGSNNNLNTYISEIRKKLEQVGIDPKSIVTVPKKGFRIDSHLSKLEIDNNDVLDLPNETITQDNYNFTHPVSVPSHSTLQGNNPSLPNIESTSITLSVSLDGGAYPTTGRSLENDYTDINNTNQPKHRHKIIFTTLLLIFLAILTTSIYIFMNKNKEIDGKENVYYTVATKDSCVIQVPTKMSSRITNEYIDFIDK